MCDFLAASGRIFSRLPSLHKTEGDVQRAMLEQHLCYSQAILRIFNGAINIFRSGIYERIHWPVRFTFILPLTIVNIPPFTITLLPLGKIDVLLKIIRMSLFDEDNTVQTLHRYLHLQTGYVDEPELYPTANKVSVLVFQSIDRHTVTSCRRCVCIEVRKKEPMSHGYSS